MEPWLSGKCIRAKKPLNVQDAECGCPLRDTAEGKAQTQEILRIFALLVALKFKAITVHKVNHFCLLSFYDPDTLPNLQLPNFYLFSARFETRRAVPSALPWPDRGRGFPHIQPVISTSVTSSPGSHDLENIGRNILNFVLHAVLYFSTTLVDVG